MQTQQLIQAFQKIQGTIQGLMNQTGRFQSHPQKGLFGNMVKEVIQAVGPMAAMAFLPALNQAHAGQTQNLSQLLEKYPAAKALFEKYLPQFQAIDKEGSAPAPKPQVKPQPKPQPKAKAHEVAPASALARRRYPTLEEQRQEAAARAQAAKRDQAKRQAQKEAQEADVMAEMEKLDRIYEQNQKLKQKQAQNAAKDKHDADDNSQVQVELKEAGKVDKSVFEKAIRAAIEGTSWQLQATQEGFNLVSGQSRVTFDLTHGFYGQAKSEDKQAVDMLIKAAIEHDKLKKASGVDASAGLTVTCKNREVAEYTLAQLQEAGVKIAKVQLKADGKTQDLTEELLGDKQKKVANKPRA